MRSSDLTMMDFLRSQDSFPRSEDEWIRMSLKIMAYYLHKSCDFKSFRWPFRSAHLSDGSNVIEQYVQQVNALNYLARVGVISGVTKDCTSNKSTGAPEQRNAKADYVNFTPLFSCELRADDACFLKEFEINNLDYDLFIQECSYRNIEHASYGGEVIKARLELVNAGTPKITMDGSTYMLKALSAGSVSLMVAEYCLTERPNETVSAARLIDEKEGAGIPLFADNINESMKTGVFNQKNGLLKDFATIQSKAITIYTERTITLQTATNVIKNARISNKFEY